MLSRSDRRRIQHLLDLADVAKDFSTINMEVINYFNKLREELGLAELLLRIQEHLTTKETLDDVGPTNQPPNTLNVNDSGDGGNAPDS